MKYALVNSTGRIVQIETHRFDVAKPLEWFQIDDDVTIEHKYVEGNFIIESYVAPPKQLRILEPYQFYAALEITGNKTKFEKAWASILASLDATGKIVAQAKLDHTKRFRPDNDLVLSMKAAMGLSDAKFEALWETGESIV